MCNTEKRPQQSKVLGCFYKGATSNFCIVFHTTFPPKNNASLGKVHFNLE